MRAVILNEDRQHELVTLPDPKPEPHQVLVRSDYVGICGSDLHAPELDMFRTGIVSGHEFAGEIVAIGNTVSGLTVGQRVTANPNANVCRTCSYCRQGRYNLCWAATNENSLGVARHGGMAEYVALDADYLHRLPESVDTRHGAWAEPLAVALRAVRTTPVRIGDSAAVIGGGPVGLLAVQLLRAAGVSRIVLVEPSEFRRSIGTRVGADATYGLGEFNDALAERDFRQVDHVFECSGHPAAVRTAQSMVAAGGSIRLVGMSPTPPAIDAIDLVSRELQLLGGYIYIDEFSQAIDLLAAGQVDVDILTTHIVPLAQFADAFAALRQPDKAIKAVIAPGLS